MFICCWDQAAGFGMRLDWETWGSKAWNFGLVWRDVPLSMVYRFTYCPIGPWGTTDYNVGHILRKNRAPLAKVFEVRTVLDSGAASLSRPGGRAAEPYLLPRVSKKDSHLLSQVWPSLSTNETSIIMGHEAVWYSRPRLYGKGSRQWYLFHVND